MACAAVLWQELRLFRSSSVSRTGSQLECPKIPNGKEIYHEYICTTTRRATSKRRRAGEPYAFCQRRGGEGGSSALLVLLAEETNDLLRAYGKSVLLRAITLHTFYWQCQLWM
jgi:hypothetical protein